ncbi:MAG TPA: transglycosylase SLT domain-containing protein [Aggregatilineales bacterium]|nr:transglycosylase SLT domain-containing protein [Aggregatilineales bacterium]
MIAQRTLTQLRAAAPPKNWLRTALMAFAAVLLLIAILALVRPGPSKNGRIGPVLSGVFTPQVQYWSPLIYAWSQAYNVDPNLIATVIQIESCGDPSAVSRSGAQGLFQVMPGHFGAGEDMLAVVTNGRRGMEYLSQALQKASGDAKAALAGYNGGHGLIGKDQSEWPAETQRYIRWGIGIYDDAVNGQSSSTTMQAWLDAGGSSLCAKAAAQQHAANAVGRF